MKVTTLEGDGECELDMGSHQKMVVVKEFGPLIACDLRVWIDAGTGEWVIERWNEKLDDWEQMARFDCQESLVFTGENG